MPIKDDGIRILKCFSILLSIIFVVFFVLIIMHPMIKHNKYFCYIDAWVVVTNAYDIELIRESTNCVEVKDSQTTKTNSKASQSQEEEDNKLRELNIALYETDTSIGSTSEIRNILEKSSLLYLPESEISDDLKYNSSANEKNNLGSEGSPEINTETEADIETNKADIETDETNKEVTGGVGWTFPIVSKKSTNKKRKKSRRISAADLDFQQDLYEI